MTKQDEKLLNALKDICETMHSFYKAFEKGLHDTKQTYGPEEMVGEGD